jgi:acetyl esterase/lipase
MAWAGQTNVPIISIDYKKAPEFPFPYGLNECFDIYKMIVATKGACIGLKGGVQPRIALAGDSAYVSLLFFICNSARRIDKTLTCCFLTRMWMT